MLRRKLNSNKINDVKDSANYSIYISNHCVAYLKHIMFYINYSSTKLRGNKKERVSRIVSLKG